MYFLRLADLGLGSRSDDDAGVAFGCRFGTPGGGRCISRATACVEVAIGCVSQSCSFQSIVHYMKERGFGRGFVLQDSICDGIHVK